MKHHLEIAAQIKELFNLTGIISIMKDLLKTSIFLIFLISISNVNAQSQIGVKGAFNYSGFRRNPDLKPGYQIGIAGKKYLGDLGWFFQTELNYSFEGAINKPLEFINIPLILGFDFSDNFNLHLGYQSGFLIGTRSVDDFEYHLYNPVINLGLEFYVTPKTVIGARFDYGISDFEKSSYGSITYNFEVYFILWVFGDHKLY